MTADKFVELVRKGSDKLRADDLLLITNQGEVHGKGIVRIEKERIAIEFTVKRGEWLPRRESGVFTASDFWKLSGVIQDHLQFRCNVGPGGSSRSFNGVETITFGACPIELVPSGWDARALQGRCSKLL